MTDFRSLCFPTNARDPMTEGPIPSQGTVHWVQVHTTLAAHFMDEGQWQAEPRGRRPEFGGAVRSAAAAPQSTPRSQETSPSAVGADRTHHAPSTPRQLQSAPVSSAQLQSAPVSSSQLQSAPVSSSQLQSATVEGASPLRPSHSIHARLADSEADSGALTGQQRRNPQQQVWTQRFCNRSLEQRFRLFQARMLQPVSPHVSNHSSQIQI